MVSWRSEPAVHSETGCRANAQGSGSPLGPPPPDLNTHHPPPALQEQAVKQTRKQHSGGVGGKGCMYLCMHLWSSEVNIECAWIHGQEKLPTEEKLPLNVSKSSLSSVW